MKDLFLKLINTFNQSGKILDAGMSSKISTVTLIKDGKQYVLSIRLEKENTDA